MASADREWGMAGARFNYLRSSSRNIARRRLRTPSDSTLISVSSPLMLGPSGRPKFPTMFAIDASPSLGMCAIFDENNIKRFTSSLVYLRFEHKDRSVCGKPSPDLFLGINGETLVTKTDVGGRGREGSRILVVLQAANEPWKSL